MKELDINENHLWNLVRKLNLKTKKSRSPNQSFYSYLSTDNFTIFLEKCVVASFANAFVRWTGQDCFAQYDFEPLIREVSKNYAIVSGRQSYNNLV